MGKHLAPKKKHELDFIKIKKRPPREAEEKRPSREAGEKKPSRKAEEKKPSRKAEEKRPSREAGQREPLNARARALLSNALKPDGASQYRLPEIGRYPWIFYALSAVALLAIRFLPLQSWMVPTAYAIPALLALPEHAIQACEGFRRGERLNDELIICLTALLLFAVRLYTESVLLLLFTFLVSLLENKLYKKCVPVHEKVSALLPGTVSVLTEEGREPRDIDAVLPGEIILVAAGERIPLDGVITEGITTIDTALISGQRSPWAVNVGYRVYAGCRNLTSDIKIRVSRDAEQSTGSRIVRVARSAGDFPSQQESLIGMVVKLYTPAVLLLAAIIGFFIPLFRGAWPEHLRRAAVLMLASRPASVLLGIPLLYQKALSLAGGIGVFVKGKDCLEAMAKAETLIFDKTGTITEGRYTVTDVFPVNMSEKQLLTIAAAAESFSRHPIAIAIREAAGRLDERIVKSVRIREIPGRGISALVGTRRVYVGNAALLEDNGLRFEIPSRPGTAIHVSVDGQYCGHILVADKVRRRAFDALETLRINGVKKLVLLTGDVLSVARPVASRLNFDMLRAEQTPADKAKAVSYLMRNKGGRATIAFVGDGENSGKLLTGADVGIAMGSLGSDAAFACADVMIMDKDIFKIPKMLIYSRTSYRIAWENAALSAVIALLFVALGLFDMTSPLVTEIAHFILGILLLLNTLRLK